MNLRTGANFTRRYYSSRGMLYDAGYFETVTLVESLRVFIRAIQYCKSTGKVN